MCLFFRPNRNVVFHGYECKRLFFYRIQVSSFIIQHQNHPSIKKKMKIFSEKKSRPSRETLLVKHQSVDRPKSAKNGLWHGSQLILAVLGCVIWRRKGCNVQL